MKKIILITLILFVTLTISAQQSNPSDGLTYSYCELKTTPKVLSEGLSFDVTLIASDLTEFRADTTYSRLLLEKKKPAFFSMSVPLNIMGSKGWKLILHYSTDFRGIIFDHFIFEKTIK